MKIIEQFLLGKKGETTGGEDRIVVTPHFAAVIDGATAKQVYDFGGPTGGALVADTIAATLQNLPADASALTAVQAFTAAVKARVFDAFGLNPQPGEDRPNASVVIYSATRGEIWRIGDCSFAKDDNVTEGKKSIDTLTSRLRARTNHHFLKNGGTTEELAQNDIGRKKIMPLLLSQPSLMNTAARGRWGYGVIDGRTVPEQFIEITSVGAARTITLASDGYLRVLSSLNASEAYLADYLKCDPQLIGPHASTKGLAKGQVAHDDRAWLKFEI